MLMLYFYGEIISSYFIDEVLYEMNIIIKSSDLDEN